MPHTFKRPPYLQYAGVLLGIGIVCFAVSFLASDHAIAMASVGVSFAVVAAGLLIYNELN
jgi:hypothetical protein